jgi:glycosyltransferase involved in cell wall biosynthesis
MDKVAFITHTTDVGGASASFLTVMQALAGAITYSDHLLIHPKTNKSDAYGWLKDTMPHFQWALPFAWIFRGAEPGLHRKAYRMFMEGFAVLAFLFKYNSILAREQVRTIYLNSLVLYILLPFLPRNMKKIIHIRESLDGSIESKFAVWVIIRYADVIATIDKKVALPFASSANVRVVPNPIDMTRAWEQRECKKFLKTRAEIPEESTVVALVAPVSKQKGHDFLLKCLERMKTHCNQNLHLKVTFALAGISDSEHNNKLTNALKEYKNVKYIGMVWDVSPIYAMSDVVIRCEDYLPIGRTVWEGMYSGLPVLLPVRPEDDKSVIIDYLGRYMFLYKAGNVDDFLSILNFIIENRKMLPTFPQTNNIAESAKGFISVLGGSPSKIPTLQYDRLDTPAQ